MASTLQSADVAAPTSSGLQLSTLLHGAGIAPLDDIGWIRVTGSDATRWLNGMVTNFVQQLAPGEGCYNFVLNAQGRIQGDLTAFAGPDGLLLQTGREQMPALLAHFNRFIVMDDVELAPFQLEGRLIAGPDALRIVQDLGGAPYSAVAPPAEVPATPHLKQTTYCDAPVYLIQAYSPLVPRFEIWADCETIARISTDLAAVPQVTPEALEQLRILEGTPRYGTDIRDKDLPQETGQTRALHFTKGCYLGQEIVERIHSRGNVHRTFSGFSLNGTLPSPGTAFTVEGRAAGELTNVTAIQLPESASSPAQLVQLALGYVRREALADAHARGLVLEYPGGVATPIALPYRIS